LTRVQFNTSVLHNTFFGWLMIRNISVLPVYCPPSQIPLLAPFEDRLQRRSLDATITSKQIILFCILSVYDIKKILKILKFNYHYFHCNHMCNFVDII
jgi:hypothetical protein